MKRIALAAIAVASLIGVGAAGGASPRGTTIDVFPVEFVVSSDVCPNLPPGTTLSGKGTGLSVVTTTTDHHGITTITSTTRDRGTASDERHNTYSFFYVNQFRVSNTAQDPGTFTGLMHDIFTLSGQGPANLSNGFLARIKTDFTTFFEFDPISAYGDPINFQTGAAICNPL